MAICVYDWQGNLQTLSYLKDKYGDFIIKEAGEGLAYRIIALRETVNTAATLIVRVLDQNGQPIDSERVAWYWPDAPDDPLAGPQNGVLPQMNPNRAVHGLTNMNGDVGFGMGRGAYYWPDQEQIGPHAVWIYGTSTRSDVILGLGMIGATNHDHFNVEYALVDPGTPRSLPSSCRRKRSWQSWPRSKRHSARSAGCSGSPYLVDWGLGIGRLVGLPTNLPIYQSTNLCILHRVFQPKAVAAHSNHVLRLRVGLGQALA